MGQILANENDLISFPSGHTVFVFVTLTSKLKEVHKNVVLNTRKLIPILLAGKITTERLTIYTLMRSP